MPLIFEYVNFYMGVYFGIKLPLHAMVIAIVIGIFSVFFIIFYCIPAFILWIRLGGLKKNLKLFKQDNVLEYPTELFNKRGKLFNHLWTEYQQTLHEQHTFNPQTGVEELVAIRSTASAEMFFSPSTVVDGQLHIEFFKHLPGILTGLGIIGTFLGLIHGLQAFRIDENTEIVRQSLDQLLHGVYEAFVVSMAAIALAMIVTLIEKFLFSVLYGKVEELCFLIDSLYQSGAGEEYLERLVKYSEESASQAKIIKDALVKDLKEILSEVTQQQIQSTQTSQQQLSEQFRESIEIGISQPLKGIAEELNRKRIDTNHDLSGALNDVFAVFTQNLQNLFGGQTKDIYDMQQKTVEALQATVTQFQQMTTNIDTTGRNTTNVMSETLTQAMEAMESRQQTMNERMMEFIEQILTKNQTSQAETGQKFQTLLGDLGQQMTRMVDDIEEKSRAASDSRQQAIETLTTSVNDTVGKVSIETAGMLNRLAALVESHQRASAQSVDSIQIAITQMSEVTTSALTGMNQGADNLIIATDEFSRAGQNVAGVLDKATDIATKLSLSADAVSTATGAIETIIGDYSVVRQQMNEMIQALKGTVESARKEASLTADILKRIDHATEKLAAAQNQADHYLSQVSEVLEKTHQSFASNMRNTLKTANDDFFQHLTNATAKLKEAIEVLDDVLGNISVRK
jgi:ABC-type transporter Mla subunit MlaD